MRKVVQLALGLAALVISSAHAQDSQVANGSSSLQPAMEQPFTIAASVGYDQTNRAGNSDQSQTVALTMELELQGTVSTSSDDINCNPPVNTPSQTIAITCSDITLQSGASKTVAITPANSSHRPCFYTASLDDLSETTTGTDNNINPAAVYMTDKTSVGSGSLAWGFVVILMGLALARSQKPKN